MSENIKGVKKWLLPQQLYPKHLNNMKKFELNTFEGIKIQETIIFHQLEQVDTTQAKEEMVEAGNGLNHGSPK